jgi:GT2 family glycosyltransferase
MGKAGVAEQKLVARRAYHSHARPSWRAFDGGTGLFQFVLPGQQRFELSADELEMEVSITLTRYREPNRLVWETLDSLAEQRDVRAEVLFLDQMQDDDTEAHIRDLTSPDIAFEYVRIEKKGLSFARSYAIRHAANNILLFIDPDAIAEPGWAKALAASLDRPGIAVAGGKIVPKWHGRPLLLTRSRIVMDQYSLLDLGPGERDVDRIVGANFGINRAEGGKEAYFDEAYGRREGRLFGGEESDLCRRVREQGSKVIYVGDALVHHQIVPERITYRWITKRLFYAGLSRAILGGRPNPTSKLGMWDFLALPVIFPAYTLGYFRGRCS